MINNQTFTRRCTAGFTVRGMLVVAILLVAVGWYVLPRYFGQLEKTQALAMQVMLINASITEERFYAKHKAYSAQWSEVIDSLETSPLLQLEKEPIANDPSAYFMGFGKNAVKNKNGFRVILDISADKESGVVKAQRVGSWFYKYELSVPFPEGKTNCISKKNQAFCARFQKDISLLDVSNLVPVVKEKPTETETETAQNSDGEK